MRLRDRAALLAAIVLGPGLLASCDGPTRPEIHPLIRLDLPGEGGTLDEATIRLRGLAEAPRIESITVHDSVGSIRRTVWEWHGFGADSSRIVIDTLVDLVALPGTHQISAVLTYVDADSTRASDTTVVSLELYRRATFGFATPIPDTVYGRSLTVAGVVPEAISNWSLALVMDPGTANEHVLDGPIGLDGLVRPSDHPDGSRVLEFDFPVPLVNGVHRAQLRLTDEQGVRTLEQGFVVHVPERRYTVRALASPFGGDAGGSDVNIHGDVVGAAADDAGRWHAVLWKHDGEAVILAPSYPGSSAVAINDAGDIVGSVELEPDCSRPVAWSDTAMRHLHLPTGPCGRAADVNASGAILYRDVGRYESVYPADSGVLIDDDGAVTAVPHLAVPVSLNAGGGAVGRGLTGYWSTLGPAASFPVSRDWVRRGQAHSQSGGFVAVNSEWRVLGSSGSSNLRSVYLTGRDDPAIDLTMALGGPVAPAMPQYLTDGDVVLAGDAAGGFYLWEDGRTSRITLATDGWELRRLSRMNEVGQIVGWAFEAATGAERAVILDPAY